MMMHDDDDDDNDDDDDDDDDGGGGGGGNNDRNFIVEIKLNIFLLFEPDKKLFDVFCRCVSVCT